MSKQKTEKQILAKELADKLLAIQTEEHEEPLYGRKYSICNINGEKWIKASSGFHYNMNGYLKRMEANGLIADYNILHARTLTKLTGAGRGRSRWQISTLVNLSAIPTGRYDIKVGAIIKDAERTEIKADNLVTVEQMEENERMYAERCRLINENNQEQRKQEQHEVIADTINKETDKEPAGSDVEQPNGDNEHDFDCVKFAAAMVSVVEDNIQLRKQVEKLTRANELGKKIIAKHEEMYSLSREIAHTLMADNQKLRQQVEALLKAFKEKEDAK